MKPEKPESLGDFINRVYIKPFKQYQVFYTLFWISGVMFFLNAAFLAGWIMSIREGESPLSLVGIITLVCLVIMVVSFMLARKISPYIKH